MTVDICDWPEPDRAGWYPDPAGGDGLRWWSGSVWFDDEDVIAAVPPQDEVAERLSNWDWWRDRPTDELILRLAVGLGETGAALLARELVRRQDYDRVLIAGALGDCTGGAGIEELRSASQTIGAGSVDLRSVSLVALAKRLGPASTPDLVRGLHDRDDSVKWLAIHCLGLVGDERPYDDVFRLFRQWLKCPQKGNYDLHPVTCAACYLLRVATDDQLPRLQNEIRSAWLRLPPDVVADLIEIWPHVEPSDGEIVDPPRIDLRDWSASRGNLHFAALVCSEPRG